MKKEFPDLPFIAEDLGDEMENVYHLREAVGLPGNKVLQFAFDKNIGHSVDAPHNFEKNFVVYTGTHDNDTTRGWYKNLDNEGRLILNDYTGQEVNERTVNDILIRLAYSSVANTAIIPMQDLLDLDENSRMNTPSSDQGNWKWKMVSDDQYEKLKLKLKTLIKLYGRHQ